MQNDFEKQVHQKMDELKFDPSKPVWENIEMQIRKKKDRRSFFFWLPLLSLLLGGSLFIFYFNGHNNSVAKSERSIQEDSKTSNERNNSQTSSKENQTRQSSSKDTVTNRTLTQKQKTVVTTSNKKNDIKEKTTALPVYSSKKVSVEREKVVALKKRSSETEIVINKNQNQSIAKSKNTIKPGNSKTDSERSSPVDEQDEGKTGIQKTVDKKTIEKETTQNKNTEDIRKEDIKTNDTNLLKSNSTDTAKANSNNNNIPLKGKKDSSKWKLIVAAGIGTSGINDGLKLFGGGAKSISSPNYYSNTPGGGTGSSGVGTTIPDPSIPKKSLAFSAGVLAKKQIGKKIAFSTGLRYNYYSTKMQVGQKFRQDSAISSSFRVNEFYTNSGTNYSSYYNRFHFLSLPVGLDFQFKIPLDFHFGFSLQRLINTNALQYSYASGIYYSNNKVYNKTLLFSDLSLNYSVSLNKRMSVAVGPFINYSHSRLEKDSSHSNHHLFSYGISAQFSFRKK